MNNIVHVKFGQDPEGYINYNGNKTPVYRDGNGRPYIITRIKEECPEGRDCPEWAMVKRYVGLGKPPSPTVSQQFQNPIYGE